MMYGCNKLVNPEQWRTPSMDDDTLWSTALAATSGDPTVVWNLTSGKIYNIADQISAVGTFRLVGNGSLFVKQGVDKPIFRCEAPYGTGLLVTSIDNTVTRQFEGSSSTDTPCAKITIQGVTPPAIGTWCKLASTQPLPYSTGTEKERMGEFVLVAATVVGATTTDIYTKHRLRETYTLTGNTLKLGPVDMSARFDLRGVELTHSAGSAPSSFKQPIFKLMGYYQPAWEMRIREVPAQGLVVAGCLMGGGTTWAASLRNDPDAGQFGYGVSVSASEAMSFDCYVERARHGFTTALGKTADNDLTVAAPSWGSYGRSAHLTIRGQAMDCALPWDLHSDAYMCTFDGVHAIGAYGGDGAGMIGVQLRGLYNRVLNPTIQGASVGVAFYAQYPDATQDCEAVNVSYVGPGSAISATGKSGSSERMRCSAMGRTFAVAGGNVVTVVAADLTLGRLEARPNWDSVKRVFYQTNLDAMITCDELDLDLTNATVGGHLLYAIGASPTGAGPAEFTLRQGRVRGAAKINRLLLPQDEALTGSLNVELDAPPATSSGILTWGAGSRFAYEFKVNGAPNEAVIGDANTTLTNSSEVVYLDTPLTANRTLTLNEISPWPNRKRFRVTRGSNSTGAYSWTIVYKSLTVAVLATAGDWVLIEYVVGDPSSWRVLARS